MLIYASTVNAEEGNWGDRFLSTYSKKHLYLFLEKMVLLFFFTAVCTERSLKAMAGLGDCLM